MINKISSLIQFGNNIQNNTIIYDANIKTILKRIDKDFKEGNIKQACDDLNSLIEENKSNQKNKYQLLIKKISFLFSLRRYDEAKKLLNNVEKNYNDFIDVSYEELKLIDLSLEKQKKVFFELADKIIAESTKPLNRTKFELMYYLNIKDPIRAKEIFENLEEGLQQSKEYALMGGFLYSNLNNYDKAHFFYQIALSQDMPFLDKSIITGFYGTDAINKHMYGLKLDNSCNQNLIEYKKTIEIILNQEKYFDNKYIENLKLNYLFILLILNEKEKYIEFYKKAQNIEDIFMHHYLQWCKLTQSSIDHQAVQEKILHNKSELLLYYASLLERGDDDSKEVILFLEENEKYIFKNQYILLFYIQVKISLQENIDTKYKDFLITNKYENLEYLLAYLTITKETSYIDVDIQKLIKFATNESQIFKRILESLDILMKSGHRRKYIDLALIHQEKFPQVIAKTLELCYEDKNLLIQDFDYFIENILSEDDYIIRAIADIYAKFDVYDKSFKYFYLIYKEGIQNKNILLKIIEISFKFYQKTNEILDKKREKEVYDILIADKGELQLRDLIFLFQYSLVVLKDTRQILPILNTKLLETDIKELNQEIKIELSNLYTQTTIGMHPYFEQLFIYEDNICYVNDGKTYLKGYEVTEKNKKNFSFNIIDNNRFFKMKFDPQYQQDSIFHRIVGPFAYKVDNPNMIPINVNLKSENPFEELFSFINESSQQEKDLFQIYSQGDFYGLYPLSKYDYVNYFTLIPYLLEHKDYSLNSLKPSFIIDRKKILTLSSIVFLNHLNYLDEVLEMEDIVIQQTTINWLQKYIEEYTLINRPTNFSYMNEEEPKFIPYTREDKKKAIEFKNFLIELTEKLLSCNKVNDTIENLSIAGAYKMLAKEMGEQEYHALAYCINHNYQIISENNIFEMLFETFGYNKLFISNSCALLSNILDKNIIYSLQKKLFENNYKYLLNCPDMNAILRGLHYGGFRNILNNQLILYFHIWYKYGYLDNLIKQYINKYKVLYPKAVLPQKDIYFYNMEYLLNILNSKININHIKER